METNPFHLHVHSGRESGLMIIGTPEALANLGQQLQAARDFTSTPETSGWPSQIAVLAAESPYRDRPDSQVSFHVQRQPLTAALQKRPRHGPSTTFLLVVAALTLFGALSLVRLLWNAL